VFAGSFDRSISSPRALICNTSIRTVSVVIICRENVACTVAADVDVIKNDDDEDYDDDEDKDDNVYDDDDNNDHDDVEINDVYVYDPFIGTVAVVLVCRTNVACTVAADVDVDATSLLYILSTMSGPDNPL
jgi:hypothetical protein